MSNDSDKKWLTWLKEQENSGLSVVAFCKERGLKPQTFYTQRYKHKKRRLSDNCAQTGDFIQVSTKADGMGINEPITVQYGDISIMLPAMVDVQYLCALVKALR